MLIRSHAVTLSLIVMMVGCGLSRYLGTNTVVSPSARNELSFGKPAAVTYLGPPRCRVVPLPFQVFGLAYDLDLVIEVEHTKWSMYEFARIQTPNGPLWIAKEADINGRQIVVADTAELNALAPEIDVPRVRHRLSVTDKSSGEELDVSVAYDNSDGQQVAARFVGQMPKRPGALRNGNTMGHSRDSLLAVIDLAKEAHASSASVSIGGERVPVRKILGVYSVAMALEQVQAGVSRTRLRAHSVAEGVEVIRPGLNETWRTFNEGERLIAVRDDPLTRLRYEFVEHGFARALVTQAGRTAPCLLLEVSPALPDLRRRFEGEARSRFVIDVNGRDGYATGEIVARTVADGVEVDFLPEAPEWAADRPMRTHIVCEGDEARIDSDRLR